jgi:iron complex transport system substrate-binding protein
MPAGLGPAEIDAYVSAARSRGVDLYHLDEGALAGLDADLVVTQDLCAVCAVEVSVIDDALTHLGCTAEVITIDPHTLDQVLDSVVGLGQATGHLEAAVALVASIEDRLTSERRRVGGRPPPPGAHELPAAIRRADGHPPPRAPS